MAVHITQWQPNLTPFNELIIGGPGFEFQLPHQLFLWDVPFSCKGAVCCTCRAKVIQGQAKMDQNFSLSEQEVEDGFILTCQAHPITKDILIDFDEI